ncbi:MAG: hypothetical protein KBT11_09200, partial [Treponema sp.]|nr:hypothetical protein [Candidatus Treponema equifaecale]
MFKKFLLLFAFLFTFQFSLFAVGGNVFHGGKVSVIHTQYFDIIFGDDCFDSAKKIASVADEYYAEISQKLGTVPYQRFPVTITREVESSNGFFSPAPFNMIVLYESFDKSPMDYSSGGIASVFYHELTHAVTLNCKSKVFRVLSAIFGDFFNPAGLSMSYFWIEGSAVLFESAGGEGRLNNPFFTQIVTQAKIESVNGGKKFPSWRDVAGARDSFPGGTDRYAFGGCFADYLVQTYGTEKYAELWKNAGTSTSLSFVAGVFKKTYGKKLDEVWSDFEASIQIPEVSDSEKSQKIEANLISDKSSIIRAFDAFYDASEKSVKIAFYDGKSGWVYLAQNGNVKKLFFADGTNHLRFSPDGKKLAVTRLVSRKNEKSEAGVYDFDLKCYTVVKKSGARDAYFDFGKDGYQLSYLTLENTQPSVENSPVCIQKSLSAKIVKTGL